MIYFDDVPMKEYFTNIFSFNSDHAKDNPKFQCLLGNCHVVTASKILLIFEVFVITPLYMLFLFPWWFIWIGAHFALILITLYALRKQKHRFMYPMVLTAAFHFLLWGFISELQLMVAIFDTQAFLRFYQQDYHEDFFVKVAVMVIVKAIILLITALLFWRFAIFNSTKNYFASKLEGEVTTTEESKSTTRKLLQPV
ncbi:unnamed protein product [Caenorhabditis bovis]|uniref:Uncharacterized protein n=1 Tax=Caenorhabditis bovis TaxID=2654633 RepID=A0A8S1EZD8_9PELO|nr:unnamed protein product [Caenorhabditis bovis]